MQVELAVRTHIRSPSLRKALTSEGQTPGAGWHFHAGCCGVWAGKGLERVSLGVRVSSDRISPCESHLLWFFGSRAVHLSKGCDGTPTLQGRHAAEESAWPGAALGAICFQVHGLPCL